MNIINLSQFHIYIEYITTVFCTYIFQNVYIVSVTFFMDEKNINLKAKD